MNGYLEMADGAIVAVHDGMVLGRVTACDVVVDDTKASRRHARLIVDAGVVEIEDLESSNGTLLNGNPVERRMLRDGDEVRIGKTVIVYRSGALPGHGTSAAPAAGGSGSALFDDDDDLLSSPTASSSPPPPVAAPQQQPPPPPQQQQQQQQQVSPRQVSPTWSEPVEPKSGEPESGEQAQQSPSTPSPSPAPAPPRPPTGKVVEFEDEVVEVRAPPPAKPAAEVRTGGPARGKPSDVVAGSQRVLQFSQKAGGKGLLGDDLGQMSAGMRTLLVIVVLVVGVAIVWGVMTAMR